MFTATTISAAVKAAWDSKYRDEIGGRGLDEDELLAVRALLAEARSGLVWTESGEVFRVGVTTDQWSDRDIRMAAGDTSSAPALAGAERPRWVFPVVIAAIIIVPVLLFVGLFWRRIFGNPVTPTASAALGSTLPAPIVIDVGGNTKLALDAPRSVEVLGRPLQVVPGSVTDKGTVKLPDVSAEELAQIAVWLQSPVNWLLGVSNDYLLSLQIGDRLTARGQTGRVLTFIVDDIRQVQPQEIELLTQRRPGLTLFATNAVSMPLTLVSARYDDTGELPEVPATQGGLGDSIAIAGGELIVSGVSVIRRADGGYTVHIAGEASVPAEALTLAINGALYPSAESLTAGKFAVTFNDVPELGDGQVWVGAQRIALGPLTAPTLNGQIVAAGLLNRGTLTAQILVTVDRDSAALRPGDFALLTGTEVELAPVQVSPAAVEITPTAPVTVQVQFALPTNNKLTTVRLRLFDQLWEVTLPATTP